MPTGTFLAEDIAKLGIEVAQVASLVEAGSIRRIGYDPTGIFGGRDGRYCLAFELDILQHPGTVGICLRHADSAGVPVRGEDGRYQTIDD